MSRRHNIKWQKSDSQDLSRAVKNFNAKISRLEKKNPELKNALPEKVSVRQLKELINTRQDLKREINSLKRFSKKGIEEIETYGDYNIKITKWQRQEMNRRVGIINRKRKQRLNQLEELEMQSGGESLGYTKGQLGMGRIERVELAPMKALTRGMNQRDVNMKWRNILKESQSEFLQQKDYRCRENYIKGLVENFNPGDVRELINKIEGMDINDFITTFYSDQDASFEGIYAPNNEQYEGYLSQLKTTWKVEEETKPTIRDFSNSLEDLKSIGEVYNGFIEIYSNDEKVGKFSSSANALNYIKKHKLENIKFNIVAR